MIKKKQRPNIVLIVMDTARRKNFSCYGYPKKTTPNIDKIAEEGILFTNAYTSSPWTKPSHASLFTGTYSIQNKMGFFKKRINPDLITLPEILKTAGYHTIGISSNIWISKIFGFERGFQKFYNTWQFFKDPHDFGNVHKQFKSSDIKGKIKILKKFVFHKNISKNLANLLYGKFFYNKYDYGARRTNRIIKRLIRKESSRPFFLFINYMETHLKYLPPKPYRGVYFKNKTQLKKALRVNQDSLKYLGQQTNMTSEDFTLLEGLYDGEITYLDSRIGELHALLKEKDLLDETIIILVSDHGENIGDHNLMGHQHSLHNTLIRIPLIIRFPKIFNPELNNHPVQITDIPTTILDILDIQNKKFVLQNRGIPLTKTRNNRAIICEYLHTYPSKETLNRLFGNLPQNRGKSDKMRCIIKNDHKFIWTSNGKHELYNIKNDPNENDNLFPAKIAKELDEELNRFIEKEQKMIMKVSTDKLIRNIKL